MPIMALQAAALRMMVVSIIADPSSTISYVNGTSSSSTSCLHSVRLVARSGDRAADKSVQPA